MNVETDRQETKTVTAARLVLRGQVQGIGMRPAIARFAAQLDLAGEVRNSAGGVEVLVEGSLTAVDQFVQELADHLPTAAVMHSMKVSRAAVTGAAAFRIAAPPRRRSPPLGDQSLPVADRDAGVAPLSTSVPADVVSCPRCLDEVLDPGERRYRYPFASCSDCGPRFSLLTRMPYERGDSSLSDFPLCPRCRAEYASPADRRFHAQTIACGQCGPQIWATDAEGHQLARGWGAVQAASAAIQRAQIVALRGLGGYQLLVDATSSTAVGRLRSRKQRPAKPLAVMVGSLTAAEQLASLRDADRRALGSRAGPIVIVAARDPSRLSSAVMIQPGCGEKATLGLMLPTTPLHRLLLDEVRGPLVCTSGNREGEPICYEPRDALVRLRGIADLWLHHDRHIVRPLDDSVVRVIANQPVVIRSARGFAPRRLDLPPSEPWLALGGQQHNAIAVSNGPQAVLGPHLGDLDDGKTRQRWIEQLRDLSRLYGVADPRLVCDLHPDYFSHQWAEQRTSQVVQVQHHHAHIAAGMLEHGWLDREVIGVAMDGTGYGADGRIWGGEFLLVNRRGFRRVGQLRPLPLAGGELAIRQPWRVGAALVYQALGPSAAAAVQFPSRRRTSDLLALLDRPRPALAPLTSSAGRLFDGIAALVLGTERCDFQGQAAMLLESACDPTEPQAYPIAVEEDPNLQLDWRPLIRRLMRDRAAGVSPASMAMRFHRGLAIAIYQVCRRFPALPVVLGGGVFQNRILVELLVNLFADVPQPLRFPVTIPPGDGGLAAGQLAVAVSQTEMGAPLQCV